MLVVLMVLPSQYPRGAMSWNEEYREKLRRAEDAVAVVRSGDRVYVHEGCATPKPLIEALLERAPDLHGVEVVHMLTFGAADYTKPEYEGHFRHNALFLGANVREAVQQGRADYTPIFLSEIEGLFTSGEMPIDVALIQTSPPDEHGFLSLGVGVDCTLTAARCARHVIAEVNRPDAAHARRRLPARQQDRRDRRDLPPAARAHDGAADSACRSASPNMSPR